MSPTLNLPLTLPEKKFERRKDLSILTIVIIVIVYLIIIKLLGIGKRGLHDSPAGTNELKHALYKMHFDRIDLSSRLQSAVAEAAKCQTPLMSLPFYSLLVEEIQRNGLLEQLASEMRANSTLDDAVRLVSNSTSMGTLLGIAKNTVPLLTTEARTCLSSMCNALE